MDGEGLTLKKVLQGLLVNMIRCQINSKLWLKNLNLTTPTLSVPNSRTRILSEEMIIYQLQMTICIWTKDLFPMEDFWSQSRKENSHCKRWSSINWGKLIKIFTQLKICLKKWGSIYNLKIIAMVRIKRSMPKTSKSCLLLAPLVAQTRPKFQDNSKKWKTYNSMRAIGKLMLSLSHWTK
jgi:hypothetical protein